MKFTHLYENLKLLDICKPVSKEESARRDKAYEAIQLKEVLDDVEKTKLADGTWHVHEFLDVSGTSIKTLKNLNVSIIDEGFDCAYLDLTSLEGGPKLLKASYTCSGNKLTNLIGAPTEVDGDFYCSANPLTSLEGCPRKVTGYFTIARQKATQFSTDDIKQVCDVGGTIYLQD